MTGNRQWRLASYPAGAVAATDFALVDDDLDGEPLGPGEVLVRNHLFSVAPTIRNRLNPPAGSYRAAIPIGGVIGGMAACEIVASAHPLYPPGMRMVAMSRWEDLSRLRPDASPVPPFPVDRDMSWEDALGLFSPNALTAYFGLLEVGRPAAGETVLVSGAAGSVGSMVCQIARIRGCRVIAIAGGGNKCAWLRDTGSVDEVIDYRADDVAARLAELAPDGVDVFFDNVGGATLQAGFDCMAHRGRIVVCGQVSAYDSPGSAAGPKDMMKLVYGSLRIEGFVVGDYIDGIEEARGQLSAWRDAGQLSVRLDVRQGLEQLPQAFVDLFSGGNDGTLLVENDSQPASVPPSITSSAPVM